MVTQYIPRIFGGVDGDHYPAYSNSFTEEFYEELVRFMNKYPPGAVEESKEITAAWDSTITEGYIGYYTQERVIAAEKAAKEAIRNYQTPEIDWPLHRAIFLKKYLQKYGYHSKPGKFIRKILPGAGDKEIEFLATYWKSKSLPLPEPQILDSEDIPWAYLHLNYGGHGGTLHNSCMKHDRCQAYMEFYVQNEVKIAVMPSPVNEDKIIARALLWEIKKKNHRIGGDYKGRDITLMDRIYATAPSVEQKMKNWAKAQGFFTRISNHHFIGPLGEQITNKIVKYEIPVRTEMVPFMDTMKFYDPDKGLLSNKVIKNSSPYSLTHTDGTYGRRKIRRWSRWEERFLDGENSIWNRVMEDYISRDLERAAVWIRNDLGEFIDRIHFPVEYIRRHAQDFCYYINAFIFSGRIPELVYDGTQMIQASGENLLVETSSYYHPRMMLSLPIYARPQDVRTVYDEEYQKEVNVPIDMIKLTIDGEVIPSTETSTRPIEILNEDLQWETRWVVGNDGPEVATYEVHAYDGYVDSYRIPRTYEQVMRLFQSRSCRYPSWNYTEEVINLANAEGRARPTEEELEIAGRSRENATHSIPLE